MRVDCAWAVPCRSMENGVPPLGGTPSTRTDRLPGFTTFVVNGLRESRGKALTTCPSRLIAVSEYRGPSKELRCGWTVVSPLLQSLAAQGSVRHSYRYCGGSASAVQVVSQPDRFSRAPERVIFSSTPCECAKSVLRTGDDFRSAVYSEWVGFHPPGNRPPGSAQPPGAEPPRPPPSPLAGAAPKPS